MAVATASIGLTASVLAEGGDGPDTAAVIPALPFSDTGDTSSGAYTDLFDVACPFTGSTSPDAWYRYTPDAPMALTIELCNSAYDTKTYVLDADFNDLGCNDDACTSPSGGAFRSLLDLVAAPAGELVYVVVDGWSGDAGVYDLTVTSEALPEQCAIADDCEGIDEGEPCDSENQDTVNGGCNSSPEVFSTFSCGDTICGNGWGIGGTRDTDWYALQGIDGPTLVTCTVTAEFDLQILLPCDDCAAVCLLGAVDVARCDTGSITYVQGQRPGTDVWWVIARDGFDGLPCGGSLVEGDEYIVTWTCSPAPCPIIGDLDGDGDVDFADVLTVLANWGDCP